MSNETFRTRLNDTQKFISDLDRACNPAEIATQVVGQMARFGAEYVCAAIPLIGASREKQLENVLFLSYPPEWVDRYLAHGYIHKDPVVRRLQSNPTPFFWSELTSLEQDDAAARRIMDEAREFRLRQGLAASLPTLDSQNVFISISGAQLDLDPEALQVLPLLASYAVSRSLSLRAEPPTGKTVRLSAREREALKWASEGKSDWEIGELMHITEHGADRHMRAVRAKLGAVNRAQAVAEAIRRGLIT